jgi:hypothetical protein
MMEEATLLQRLSLIKYLYETAISQSRKPAPMSMIALLMFHDSIEWFLELAARFLDIGVPSSFMDYWEKLLLKGHNLTHKEQMKRLNRARDDWKHYFIPLSREAIEEFSSDTSSFLRENCRTLFGMEWDEISLLDLIGYEDVRTLLQGATKDKREKKYEDGLEKVALAFDLLFQNYEKNKKKHGRSVFSIGEDVTFLRLTDLTSGMAEDFMRNFSRSEFVRKIVDSIEALQDAVRLLALGIDFKKYVRFRHLTPALYWGMDGSHHVSYKPDEISETSEVDYDFCVGFCVECYLKLMEFDFEAGTQAIEVKPTAM